jgi:23S rRNA pseudouridine2605 synthase
LSRTEKSPGADGAPGAQGTRLQVYLARCGVGSRRHCDELIAEGRVAVNGTPVSRMGTKVHEGDSVTVDGRKVKPSGGKVYIALHKPRGYLCANSDPEGRPLASQLFASVITTRLFHVGRLDFLSSGLILYTNDGEFSKIVTHPSSGIEKEYLVEAARPIEEALLKQYQKGIQVGEERYRCKSFTPKGSRAALVTLTAGKNREIRTVFASRNIRLKRVHRVRIGPVHLKGLLPGHFRKLTEREVRWFLAHGSGD